MYLMVKSGFFEVDRWDGSPVPEPQHQAEIEELVAMGRSMGVEGIAVVRCRHQAELVALLRRYSTRQHRIWKSPPGWDYEWRAYLTLAEWAAVMAQVGADLSYRNFKSWCHGSAPWQAELAHAVWTAAFTDARRRH